MNLADFDEPETKVQVSNPRRELNNAVYDAIGQPEELWDRRAIDGSVCWAINRENRGVLKLFDPSGSLEDAFWAAEEFDIFLFGRLCFEITNAGDWGVMFLPNVDDVHVGKTPAMAVCNGIIKLKEQADEFA